MKDADMKARLKELYLPPANDFVLVDERYSYLRVSPEVEVLATHEHDELEHPVFWAYQRPTSRVVYDGLGHDAQSYDSEDHRGLVLNAADWLLEHP